MDDAPARARFLDLVFDGLSEAIRVRAPEEAVDTIRLLFSGWPWREGAAEAPHLRIARQGAGYAVDVPGLEPQPAANAVEAAHMLVGSLIAHLIRGRDSLVSFHAASVQTRTGLVVCLGASFAGKSSVGLHAAAQGARFFGDDRIVVELGSAPHGIAQGLAPKLRLPVPEDAGDAFRRFLDAHRAREAQGLLWLDLDATAAASFGEARKLAGFVLLDRSDGAATSIAPASRAKTTEALLRHAFAPGVPVAGLVGRMAALAAAVPADTVRFASSREAAAAVLARHGGPA